MDSYLPWQISQSDYETSSNCGKNLNWRGSLTDWNRPFTKMAAKNLNKSKLAKIKTVYQH